MQLLFRFHAIDQVCDIQSTPPAKESKYDNTTR